MAKTYAESVKLPNLVVNVPHPSKKYMLTKNGLNIEGRNNSAAFNKDDFNSTNSNKNQDRKAYIASLIGGKNRNRNFSILNKAIDIIFVTLLSPNPPRKKNIVLDISMVFSQNRYFLMGLGHFI